MKFAILSLAAAGALTLSAGSASAQPGHYHGGHNHGGYGGYNRSYHPPVPHLDYHRGHYHYHDGFYRSGPLYPVYPSYSYPSYGFNSGYNIGISRPGFSINIGSGSPYYGGGFYNQPYYGGYGRRW